MTLTSSSRTAGSQAAVLAAAAELLGERGYAGVTIEAIAKRAGVARSTIYRHWDNLSALVADAFQALHELPETQEVHDTGELRTDLIMALSGLVAGLARSRWGPLVPAMLEAAERDPKLRGLIGKFIAQRRAAIDAVLTNAARRGELDAELDLELAVDSLVGPLFYRRLITRRPVDQRLARALVDQFLAAHQRRLDDERGGVVQGDS